MSALQKQPQKGKQRKRVGGELSGALDALAGELPATKAGQVEYLWPRIEAALRQGHRPKQIWQRLESAGLDMSLEVFRVCLSRVKKRAGKLRREDTIIKIEPEAGVATSEASVKPVDPDGGGRAATGDAQRTLDLLKSKSVTFRRPGELKGF